MSDVVERAKELRYEMHVSESHDIPSNKIEDCNAFPCKSMRDIIDAIKEMEEWHHPDGEGCLESVQENPPDVGP